MRLINGTRSMAWLIVWPALCWAANGRIDPVLVHHLDEAGKLAKAPSGTKITVAGRIKTIPGWQGGQSVHLPPSGETLTIHISGGLNPTRGTIAFWFKVYDHPKWQLETTPLVTLQDTDGSPVHIIRRTEATVHYGKNGALGYTQTGDAFRLLSDEWRHAALVWDAEGSDAPTPHGAVTFYVDGFVQGLFYIDLAEKPLAQVILGGGRCDSAVDRLVIFDQALNREAILETKVVDETLGARVAAAMRDWGPERIALERRERRLRDIVRRADAIVIEAEAPLLGRSDPGIFRPLRPWSRPRDAFVKYAYAKDEHGQMAMKVKMAIPREYQSQANVSSGNACRAMCTKDPLTWSFTVPKTGEYAILLRYSYAREFAVFQPLRTIYYEWGVQIDGKPPFKDAERFKLPQTGNGYDPLGGDMYPFKYWAVGNGRKVHLKKGKHTISVQNFSPLSLASGTYTDDKTEALDCIVLTPSKVTNPAHPEHLADYQRTPEMWVDCRTVSESSGKKHFTYTVLMRSRSDAPATYQIRLDTGRLKDQRASLPLDGRIVTLDPRGEIKLAITFSTPTNYHGSERCLVRIWQLENRTRYDWWMWNSVPHAGRGRFAGGKVPHKPYRKRRDGQWHKQSQASIRRAERIVGMSEQEIKALVPKWNHVRYPGDKPRLQDLLQKLRGRHKTIHPDTLASIRGEIEKPRDLLGVRAMLASEAWEFHGGMKRAGVLRDLGRAYVNLKDEKYARAARTLWMEVVRAFSRRLNTAYVTEYREDRPALWGDPWGNGYAVGFGAAHQMRQVIMHGQTFFRSPVFTERDRLRIEHNMMLRHVRLAMNNNRKDDIGQWSLGGQMGWQEMPELAVVLGNDWFLSEYVKCIKTNLKGFAADGIDTSNWISSYGGAYTSALLALQRVPNAGRILKTDPAFAAKLHNVATAWARASFSNGMPVSDHDGGTFGWVGQIHWPWAGHKPMALEFARDRFGDTRAPRLLKHLNACKATGEILDGERTVAWLDETLPSVLFPDTGLGVLNNRSGSEDPRDWIELYMDYGKSGGPHGHAAKLHVLLWGHHTLLSRDCNYGDRVGTPIMWGWAAKNPSSHNTVIVNRRAPGAGGTVNVFADRPRLKVLDVSCDRASGLTRHHPENYASRRVLMLADRYYLDLFRVADDAEKTYTWMWHNWGAFDMPGMKQGAGKLAVAVGPPILYTNAVDGQPYINSVHFRDGTETWEATWDFAPAEARAEAEQYSKAPKSADPWRRIKPGEKLALRMIQLGSPGARIEAARVPLLGREKGKKKVVCRNWQVFATRKATKSVYATVFETYRDRPKITQFVALDVLRDGKPALRHEAIAVKVTLDGGREDIVLVNFAGGTVEVPQAKIRTDATHLQMVYQNGQLVRREVVGGTLFAKN